MTPPNVMSALEWHKQDKINRDGSIDRGSGLMGYRTAESYAAYVSTLAVNEVIEKDAQAIEQFNVLADSPKELAAIIRARKVTP